MFVKGALWLIVAVVTSTATSALLNHFTFLATDFWPWCTGFLAALFIILHIVYSRKKDPADLASALIGGFVFRFLAGLVFLLVFFLVQREGFFYLALHFIAQWFLFTLAEIAYLSSITKKTDPPT